MRTVFLTVLAALCASQAHADSQSYPGPEATARAYSQALLAADCAQLTSLMPSVMIERHPIAPQVYCDIAQQWRREGMSERLRAPTVRMSSGPHRLVVVPSARFIVTSIGPQITDSMYVVHSNDGGRQWRVLDIGCASLQDWVKAIYPPYDGTPAFPPGKVTRWKTS